MTGLWASSSAPAEAGFELVGRPVAAPEVLSAVHGDRTILLDLRTEHFLGLDEVGTIVWAEVVQGGRAGVLLPELLDALAVAFDAPRGVLARDLGTLLDRLSREGVVEGVARGECAPRPGLTPSAVRCVLTLIGVVIGLRLLGLRRSLAAARRLVRAVPPVVIPNADFLTQTVRKVDTAAAFFPWRALCLEQSFALFILLRRAGVPVRLRIGVQPYPFAAHAWVEYQGEPVGESYDRVGKFVPFGGLEVD